MKTRAMRAILIKAWFWVPRNNRDGDGNYVGGRHFKDDKAAGMGDRLKLLKKSRTYDKWTFHLSMHVIRSRSFGALQ